MNKQLTNRITKVFSLTLTSSFGIIKMVLKLNRFKSRVESIQRF